MPAHRIIVTGHVQGVFFRAETKVQADALKLMGWVRNTDDGSVEIHAEGDEGALRMLEAWCRKGPSGARVEEVLSQSTTEQECMEFAIRR